MNKQQDWPTLFTILEQLFKEVTLNAWKYFISACSPDEESKMYKNQQDYLKALAGISIIGDNLIHWFHTICKLGLMPMHNHMCS